MIHLTDLAREYQQIGDEISQVVQESMAGGHYILGPSVEAFEAEFAAYCGARHGVGVGSGTDAIRLALIAAGIKPGDEVITVSFTAVPTVAAVVGTGGVPVLIDIDPQTMVMDVSGLEAAITPRTFAILPVHLYGMPVDMDPLLAIARRHNLLVVEDACQAHGSEYRGRKTGSLGDIGCFSFYPTKNLGAFGDAGMVITNDDAIATKVRMLRNHGQDRRFHSVAISANSRLDDIQGAVLRLKLRYLDDGNARRRRIAELYQNAFHDLPLTLPIEPPAIKSNHHLYVVRAKARDSLRSRLAAAGVDSDVHYPLPVHRQPAYAGLQCHGLDLSVSEDASRTVITLPLFPSMTNVEVQQVIDGVRAAFAP